MKQSRLLVAVCVYVCLSCISTRGFAAYVYSYVGNAYDLLQDQDPPQGSYSGSNFISVSFTLPSLLTGDGTMVNLTPDSFTMSDQRFTLTDQTAETLQVSINPDANGDFTNWTMIAILGSTQGGQTGDQFLQMTSNNNIGIQTDNSVFRECTGDASIIRPSCPSNQDLGEVQSNPGTWTVTLSQVPVPAAAWLFGSGLLGLAGIARRSKTA